MRRLVTGFLLLLIWMFLVFFVAFGNLNPNGPIIYASIVGFLVAFLPFPSRTRTLKHFMVAMAIYGLFMGGMYLFRDAPVARYLAAYGQISVGMSLAEVEVTIRRELPYHASSIQGDLENGWVRFESIDSSYNADHLDILMYKGRVVEIGPIPD